MRRVSVTVVLVLVLGPFGASHLLSAQESKLAGNASTKPAEPAATAQDAKSGQAYSGMYAFLKEGEFVQVSVDDQAASPDSFRASATGERPGRFRGPVFQEQQA